MEARGEAASTSTAPTTHYVTHVTTLTAPGNLIVATLTSEVVASSTTSSARPLTTIFTPPTWCSDVLYTHMPVSTYGILYSTLYWRGTNSPGVPSGSRSACYPADWNALNPYPGPWGYSPGVCPAGYSAFTSGSSSSDGEQWSYCCSRYTLSTRKQPLDY